MAQTDNQKSKSLVKTIFGVFITTGVFALITTIILNIIEDLRGFIQATDGKYIDEYNDVVSKAKQRNKERYLAEEKKFRQWLKDRGEDI